MSTRFATSPSSGPRSRSACSSSSAEVARDAGLVDYKVQANVGRSAGQTIFHLHWHVIGDTKSHLPVSPLTAVTEL